MATHKDFKTFAVKYNKEFKIAGINKMKKLELINVIEDKLKKSRKEIRDEYKQLKNMVKVTKPKTTTVTKPKTTTVTKPKTTTVTKPKTTTVSKPKTKTKKLNYDETTLRKMYPILINAPLSAEAKKFTKAELDIAYTKVDKVIQSKVEAGKWKEAYEDKYKQKETKKKVDKIFSKPEPVKKKEPVKKTDNLSDRLKKFNIEVMQYLNKVNERKVKSMDQNKREKTALINFVEKNAPNSKVLQIENSPVIKDNRKFYIKGPKRFIFSKSVDKKTIDFIENNKPAPKKAEPKKETNPKKKPVKKAPVEKPAPNKSNQKINDLLFKIENDGNYNDNFNTLIKFLQKKKDKNIFPIELTFAFTQKQNEENFKALDNNPKLFMEFMAELAKYIKDNNDLNFNILKKYDKKPSNMSVKSQNIIIKELVPKKEESKKKDDKELKLKSNLSKMLYNKMFGYMTGSSKKSYTEDELLFAYKYIDDFLDGDQLSEWKRVYNDKNRVGKAVVKKETKPKGTSDASKKEQPKKKLLIKKLESVLKFKDDYTPKNYKRDKQLIKLYNKVYELDRKKYNKATSGLDLSKSVNCYLSEYEQENTAGKLNFNVYEKSNSKIASYLFSMIYCEKNKNKIMKEINEFTKLPINKKDKVLDLMEEKINITCKKINSYEKEVKKLIEEFKKIKIPPTYTININKKRTTNEDYMDYKQLIDWLNDIIKIVNNMDLFCDKVMNYYSELFN